MNKALSEIRVKFALILVGLVVAFSLIIWGVLQVINVTRIGSEATIAEVHSSSKNSQELMEYIEQQKAFEAHFVTLASDIKDSEQRTLTIALTATAIGTVLIAIPAALIISRQLMKPVEDAYESQERFLQDAAHELRNPLAALTIALQQHGNKPSDPKLVETFRRQTKRLVAINEDLLFLEKRSQVDESLTRINVSELFEDVLEDVSLSARRKSISLDAKTEADITKIIAPSDYVRIIKNLLDNAIKYSPNGTKVIARQKKVKGGFSLHVSDQGIGIPDSEIQKIGDRFFRASNVGAIDGTGLGFAIIIKILNSYGGDMQINSVEGKGTTIRIFIPA